MSNHKYEPLHPDVLRQSARANDIPWADLVPLEIIYGTKPCIKASGLMYKKFASILEYEEFIVRGNDGVYRLNLDSSSPSKEAVESLIRRIEDFCVHNGDIPSLRGERLYLCDHLNPSLKQHYASYDRHLDVLGLRVHSVAAITYQTTGRHKDKIIVAERDPVLAAINNDSDYDIGSGAIQFGSCPDTTLQSELYDEFGLSQEQVCRAQPIGVINTHRTRKNQYSIVPETMQVYLLGLSGREFHALACHDWKETVHKGEVYKALSNRAFKRFTPDELKELLRKRRVLKNGKALAMLKGLIKLEHISRHDKLFSETKESLTRPPLSFDRRTHEWLGLYSPALTHKKPSEARL